VPFGTAGVLTHEITRREQAMRSTLILMTALLAVATCLATPAGAAEADTQAANEAVVLGMMRDVFDHHDLAVLDRVMAEGYAQHNPVVPQGREGFCAYLQATFAAVPDWHFELRKSAAQGDLVWTYGAYVGTQRGSWAGIPATGKAFSMDAADIWRVADGHVVEHWDVLDIAGLLRQLGVGRSP